MKKRTFGLIGKNISYSFSKTYFAEKFNQLEIEDCEYKNFDLQDIQDFKVLKNSKELKIGGFNVTIPYKEEIIPFLDRIDEDAQKIGAVNTIKFDGDQLVGYNTDVYGFENSIKPLLKNDHKKALILGTGGASKAISFVLDKLNISYLFVSRKPNLPKVIAYTDLTEEIMKDHTIIINTTPVGTFPDVNDCPNIPYELITDKFLVFDVIYNPSQTELLKRAKDNGAVIKNGFKMLELQADKSWQIWNS